jgi:hypothetical protein
MGRGQSAQPTLVTLEQIRAAAVALEQDRAAGRLSEPETAERINRCRRAVTPRELWKASGGRGGSRRRSDWPYLRRTAFRLVALLIMIALGMWLATVTVASLHGGVPAGPTG